MLTMTTEPKRPAIEGEEHGPFRSVPFVARALHEPERTLRHRCRDVCTWVASMHAERMTIVEYTMTSRTVPALKLGALWRIPVWWYTAIIEAGEDAPEEETG